MDKKEIIREIITGIAKFKLIPFFGAGMSKPCGAASWGELIAKLRQELGSLTENYLSVAQEYEEKFGRKKLISRLNEMCFLTKSDSDSLENHMRIIAMNPPLIYTTNYDNAIEEAATSLHRNYKKIVGLNDIVESGHNEKQIIKFHGDFSNPDSIIFTKTDYDRRLKADEDPLDILFRSHILGKSVLFLGYGFGDENIDYIFKKHSELYGSKNLLRSYIVSFESNPEKEKALQDKNVVTLKLQSADELSKLISEVGEKVFHQSSHGQFDQIFNPLPDLVLTPFEFKELEKYLNSSNYSAEEKHDKILHTLEMKIMSKEVEKSVCALYEIILNTEADLKIKEAILISFQHINLRYPEYIFKICMDLLRLTDYPQFVTDLQNFNWGPNVLMIIEHKLNSVFVDAVELRKWICVIILGYLEGMHAENKKIPVNAVNLLLDGLKNYRYDEFDDLGMEYNKDKIQETLDFYFSEHGQEMKVRFYRKSFFDQKKQTISEIMNEMMKSFPKNLE